MIVSIKIIKNPVAQVQLQITLDKKWIDFLKLFW